MASLTRWNLKQNPGVAPVQWPRIGLGLRNSAVKNTRTERPLWQYVRVATLNFECASPRAERLQLAPW